MCNMSSKMSVRSSRLNIDKALLIDLGIICGVAVGYQFAVRPLAKLVGDRVGVVITNLHELRIPFSLQRRWNAFLEAYRMHQRRGSLVRTIAYYVPFLPPTPRVAFGRYWNDDEYESLLGGTALSHFRKFFRDDTYSESEDETECGAAGLIYDYGGEADDLTEQFDDSRIDGFGSTLWGTTDMTYNFEKELFRPHPTCSTPTIPRKFDPLDDLRSVSEVSECNTATQAKVAALESELSEMRVMIAKILAAQNGATAPTPTFRPQTDSSPAAFVPIVPQSAAPLPPPLPPPPPPMPTVATHNASSIKLKVGNVVSSPVADNNSEPILKQGKLPPTNIIDVLKDLPSVKLRSVAKSPGGTPMRQPRTPNMNDPASMIAAALKNRFAKMHSPGSEVELSDDDFDDKENESCGMNRDENDGFSDISPARPRSAMKRRQLSEKNSLGIAVVCSNARKSLEAAMTLDHVNFPETY